MDIRMDIHFQISAKHPETHLLDVLCTIQKPDPNGQQFSLPAWIPGSYLIRDFAKHVVSLEAYADEKRLPITLLDKNTWQTAPHGGPITLHYQIYAFDLTPRGAHVNSTHAFFNGSRVFMMIKGFEEHCVTVDFLLPEKSTYQDWQLATSMEAKAINLAGFGQYQAKNYEDLIDHPVEMGHFKKLIFMAAEIPHTLVISGNCRGDFVRLMQDLQKLCEYQLTFFQSPPPIKQYLFLLTVLKKPAYGGIEHNDSSCLITSQDNLPKLGMTEITNGYRSLLGLFSHEYFHLWNVKRIKPKAFVPYQLGKENYTRLLWVFEGITSYYDELMLLRSGLITLESYFELLGQLITGVYNTPGRFKQTLSDASFLAWTKFYQPDENTPNSSISYYTKGALAALTLDLTLRQQSGGQCSLDDVMRAFWIQYGQKEQPVEEEGFETLVRTVSGLDLSEFFNQLLRSTSDLDLVPLFRSFSIELLCQYAETQSDLGGRLNTLSNEILAKRSMLEVKLMPGKLEAEIAVVFSDSSAEEAGLAPLDVIIAINGTKVTRDTLENMIASFPVGETVMMHVFRGDELMSFNVTLRGGWYKTYVLKRMDDYSDNSYKLLTGWVGNII